jgi:DNA repair exonuclease SbcCD ATPase subunit
LTKELTFTSTVNFSVCDQHIHQQVGNSGRVMYVGAPLQFTYGDADDTAKGFISYNPATNAPAELYRNPHAPQFFSKSFEEWQQLIEQGKMDENASSNPVASPAASTSLGWLSGKCVQIVLPPGFDRQDNRSFSQLHTALIEQCGVSDIKLKQLEQRITASEASPPAVSDSVNGEVAATAAVDGITTAVEPAVVAAPSDLLVSALESGEMKPLVSAFLQEDQSVSTADKPQLEELMAEIVSAAMGEASKRSKKLRPEERTNFIAQLATVEITNFLSVHGSLSFDFSALTPGVWFICGPNGSGKSLLLEALTWTLFGKTLRGHQSEGLGSATGGVSMDDVVNHASMMEAKQTGNPATRVSVQVRFTNGFAFTRTHVFGQAGSELQVRDPARGLLERMSSKKLDQERAESILGVDLTGWSSTALLSSNTKNFLSASSDERRAVVEELLGCGSFVDMQEECKKRQKATEASKDITTVENQQLEAQLKVHQQALSKAVGEVDSLTSSVTEAERLLMQQQKASSESAALLRSAEEKLQSARQQREAQSVVVRGRAKEVQLARDALNLSHVDAADQTKRRADRDLSNIRQRYENSLRQQQRQLEQAANKAVKQATQATEADLLHRASALEAVRAEIQRKQKQKQDGELWAKELQLKRDALAARLQLPMSRSLSDLHLLQGVASVLEEATSTSDGELMEPALRERLETEALQPVEEVISHMQGDSKAAEHPQDTQTEEAQHKVQDLQNRCHELELLLGKLADEGDIEFELDSLRSQEGSLKALMTKSSAPPVASSESDFADVHSSAAWLELEASIKRLEDPSSCGIPEVVAAAAAANAANAALEEVRSSLTEQQALIRATEKRLSAEEQSLSSLVAAEENARESHTHAIRSHHSEELKLEAAKLKLSALQNQLTRAKTEHSASQSEFTAATEAYTSKSKLLESLSSQLKKLTYWSDRLTNADSKQARTAARSGTFRRFCLDRMVGLLNPLLKRNLQLFSQDDSGAITHSLACILDSTLQLDATDGSPSLANRSEGQRKRSHLALFLALFSLAQSRSGGFSSRFLFLDEAFDSLDEDGQRAVHRWIAAYANGEDELSGQKDSSSASHSLGRYVFVITHSPYAHPSLSRGCLHVRLNPATRASTYRLEAPGSPAAQEKFITSSSSKPTTQGVEPALGASRLVKPKRARPAKSTETDAATDGSGKRKSSPRKNSKVTTPLVDDSTPRSIAAVGR